MGNVIAIMTMSLDGFVASTEHDVSEVMSWYGAGDVDYRTGGADPMTFRVSQASADYITELTSGLGALVTGRRTFETADGWGGNHPWGPAYVVAHEVPDGWPRPDSTVHFVSDGVESAVAQARAAAGAGSVALHGGSVIQQALNAGLVDELAVDVASVLVGSGIRLFDHLEDTPARLGDPTVVAGTGVTHLRYPVRRS